MAYTFFKSQGINIGKSISDDESLDFAKRMLEQYSEKIILPVDSKVTKIFEDTSSSRFIDNYEFDELKQRVKQLEEKMNKKTIAIHVHNIEI